MAMKPYPSNTIIFYVDETLLTEEVRLAIKRSWTHIAEVLVRPRPPEEGDDVLNYQRVIVKFGTRHYLRSADDEADENWAERMEQHLRATMRKISSNNIAFNRQQRKTGAQELELAYMEFELEQGALVLEYHLDSNGALPLECADAATKVREALNSGKLDGAVRVRMPSEASFVAQYQAALEAKEQAAAAEEAAEDEDAATQAAQEAENVAAEQFLESPELVAQAQQEAAEAAKQDSPFEIAPLTAEEWEAAYGVPDADFALDYTRWDIVYEGGQVREFSSETMDFLA